MNDSLPTDRPDIAAVSARFRDLDLQPAPLQPGGHLDQWFLAVPAEALHDVARYLRDEPTCDFAQVCDLTCVDYLEFPKARDRYAVIYSLLSLAHNRRLWLKVFLNDPEPAVDSVTDLWPGANWLEREVYDMFGITFTDHPDLRRILTWDGFDAHPLRKDYPLRGRGERENYERLTRESA